MVVNIVERKGLGQRTMLPRYLGSDGVWRPIARRVICPVARKLDGIRKCWLSML